MENVDRFNCMDETKFFELFHYRYYFQKNIILIKNFEEKEENDEYDPEQPYITIYDPKTIDIYKADRDTERKRECYYIFHSIISKDYTYPTEIRKFCISLWKIKSWMQICILNTTEESVFFGIADIVKHLLIETLINFTNYGYNKFCEDTKLINIRGLSSKIKLIIYSRKLYKYLSEFISDCFCNQKNKEYHNILVRICKINYSCKEMDPWLLRSQTYFD